MSAAPTTIPGLPPTDYYAPTFRVTVNGKSLDPTTMGDVLDVKVTMDLENLTGFDLSINNWDDTAFDFKYSDTDTFDVGNAVDVQMGYADRLRFMARGVISALTPHFPESGPPTLGVTGVDTMFKLKGRKPANNEQKKFENKADWEIAQIIAKRNNLKVNVGKNPQGEKHPTVLQKNQDDAQFLMERAKRIDYDCYIRIDPENGQDTLYFLKPPDNRGSRGDKIYVFEYGRTLINFNPTLQVGDQVAKVTVRGWNAAKKEKIVYTATPADLPGGGGSGGGGGGSSGPETVQKKLNDKQDIVIDQPVASYEEARALAISLLRERAGGYLTGSGQVIGLPDLRPGEYVELKGLGKRFSLIYRVTKVTHTLNNSGYQTQFDVTSFKDSGTD